MKNKNITPQALGEEPYEIPSQFFTRLEESLDTHFPKGKCSGRGPALVLFADANLIFRETLDTYKGELKQRLLEYPKNVIEMNGGKLPWAIFGGKASEEEKNTIYIKAFEEAARLLS